MTDVSVPAKASIWEDCLEIFYAPSRVYARRGETDWGIPLLVLVVLSTVLTLATWNLGAPLAQADAIRGFMVQAAKQHMTADQIEQARTRILGFLGFGKYIAIVFIA